MHYYQHHLGDYAKDTGHLSVAEHGAYRLLLDHYYSTESALPLEIEKLCRIARAFSRPERDAVARVAREFFIERNGALIQKRVDKELAEYRRLKEKNAINGRSGGRPRKNPLETHSVSSGLRLGNPEHNPNESNAGAVHDPVSNSHSEDTSYPDGTSPSGKRTSRQKKESPADPRHHEITSRFGAMYRDATGEDYPFDAKDASKLKRFLSGWRNGTVDEFLDRARDIIIAGRTNQFAGECKRSQSIFAICHNWTSAGAELSGMLPSAKITSHAPDTSTPEGW